MASEAKSVEVVADMRSDTVTKPTAEMRAAMAAAEVGDDVYRDDPTVLKLEALAAETFGKEAALFVPSGTMGNLLSVLCHCHERGSEFICGDQSHIFYYEQGGSATLAGAHPRSLPNKPDGTIDLHDIEHAIRGDDPHFPRTVMIAIENTHNRMGGKVLPVEYIDAVGALASKHGIKVHMDGARIFNAAAGCGQSVKRICQAVDSVNFCLSKALGAPVGSMIVGSSEFIGRALRWRKALGGGMRQVGVLAAAGIIALRDMPAKLPEDHSRAKKLGEALNAVEGVSCDVSGVHSNLVMFSVQDTGIHAGEFTKSLQAHGVLVGAKDEHQIRAAIHHQVDDAAVEACVKAVAAVAAAGSS